jgi:hypothetical protein
MGLNLTLLSFIVCIKLKCNKRHTYGLNLDLGIQKAIRKKKKTTASRQSRHGSRTKTTTRTGARVPG